MTVDRPTEKSSAVTSDRLKEEKIMNKRLTEKKNVRRAARAFHKKYQTDLFQRSVKTARYIRAYRRRHGRNYRRELEKE